MNQRCRAVDAAAIKIKIYLVELEGACMGEKYGCLDNGRPRAFLKHYLLHSALVHFEHGATSQVSESPVGLRAGAPQRQRGMCQAGSSQGSVWFPAEPAAPQPRSSSVPSPAVSDPLCRAAGQGLSPPAGTAANRTLNWTPNKADLSACQHGDS